MTVDDCPRCHQGPETHRTLRGGTRLCDDGMRSDDPTPHVTDVDDDDDLAQE